MRIKVREGQVIITPVTEQLTSDLYPPSAWNRGFMNTTLQITEIKWNFYTEEQKLHARSGDSKHQLHLTSSIQTNDHSESDPGLIAPI